MTVLVWERKISKVRYTHYIALPPDWVKNKLRGSKTVQLVLEEDGSLRIIPAQI